MHLTPEQKATLQACGYQVLAATPEQLQRLTQQRRVFAACGGSVVVRRADGFLETHATLAAMLEQHAQARNLVMDDAPEAGSAMDRSRPAAPQDPEPVTDGGEADARASLEQARADLVAEFESKAAALGLSAAGLVHDRMPAPGHGPGGRSRRAGAQVSVRYRGPNGQEWSGRGRPPAWIITHEAIIRQFFQQDQQLGICSKPTNDRSRFGQHLTDFLDT
ncbi:H-NS family nucleoid-associated regulatory protein [Roseomonas mucosa]|uniref:H-NS family nucleoid-associated regulatory protein n=1 Tax=Roseomonas mucosa TaxID=207340 RepID=UPI0028CBD94E|nr:H-NS family nucleoid-associated regulatory protein [Roseomonas mucosa]MDT8316334.1 H-NS family nucleoid-associated regulatory protein [Roseomonas mucosa]